MGFLKVLPPVLIFVGCVSFFFSFKVFINFSIFCFFLNSLLNEALKNIKSLSRSFSLYPNFIFDEGIVKTLPFLSIA